MALLQHKKLPEGDNSDTCFSLSSDESKLYLNCDFKLVLILVSTFLFLHYLDRHWRNYVFGCLCCLSVILSVGVCYCVTVSR